MEKLSSQEAPQVSTNNSGPEAVGQPPVGEEAQATVNRGDLAQNGGGVDGLVVNLKPEVGESYDDWENRNKAANINARAASASRQEQTATDPPHKNGSKGNTDATLGFGDNSYQVTPHSRPQERKLTRAEALEKAEADEAVIHQAEQDRRKKALAKLVSQKEALDAFSQAEANSAEWSRGVERLRALKALRNKAYENALFKAKMRHGGEKGYQGANREVIEREAAQEVNEIFGQKPKQSISKIAAERIRKAEVRQKEYARQLAAHDRAMLLGASRSAEKEKLTDTQKEMRQDARDLFVLVQDELKADMLPSPDEFNSMLSALNGSTKKYLDSRSDLSLSDKQKRLRDLGDWVSNAQDAYLRKRDELDAKSATDDGEGKKSKSTREKLEEAIIIANSIKDDNNGPGIGGGGDSLSARLYDFEQAYQEAKDLLAKLAIERNWSNEKILQAEAILKQRLGLTIDSYDDTEEEKREANMELLELLAPRADISNEEHNTILRLNAKLGAALVNFDEAQLHGNQSQIAAAYQAIDDAFDDRALGDDRISIEDQEMASSLLNKIVPGIVNASQAVPGSNTIAQPYDQERNPKRKKLRAAALAAGALVVGIAGGLLFNHITSGDKEKIKDSPAAAAPNPDSEDQSFEKLLDKFTIEASNGYTQELEDSFPGHKAIDYKALHEYLLDEFGQDYITGVGKYVMPNGQLGLAESDKARFGNSEVVRAAIEFLANR